MGVEVITTVRAATGTLSNNFKLVIFTMHPLEACQKILLPQGVIYLGLSDSSQSVGYIELNPHTSLPLHKRPALEILTQIKNKCDMVVYRDTYLITTMHEGDTLNIGSDTYHIHVNPYDEISLTYWHFEGDIREIIDKIRNTRL